MFIFISVVSLVIASARVGGFKSKAYQAFAHLWVGILIGAALFARDRFCVAMAIGLVITEVIMFAIGMLTPFDIENEVIDLLQLGRQSAHVLIERLKERGWVPRGLEFYDTVTKLEKEGRLETWDEMKSEGGGVVIKHDWWYRLPGGRP